MKSKIRSFSNSLVLDLEVENSESYTNFSESIFPQLINLSVRYIMILIISPFDIVSYVVKLNTDKGEAPCLNK